MRLSAVIAPRRSPREPSRVKTLARLEQQRAQRRAHQITDENRVSRHHDTLLLRQIGRDNEKYGCCGQTGGDRHAQAASELSHQGVVLAVQSYGHKTVAAVEDHDLEDGKQQSGHQQCVFDAFTMALVDLVHVGIECAFDDREERRFLRSIGHHDC